MKILQKRQNIKKIKNKNETLDQKKLKKMK
jgi:hypothetical protein